MKDFFIYAVLGILFAGAQYLIPKKEYIPFLMIRTLLLFLALISLIMMVKIANFKQ
jgi:hypothetical protein